MNARYSICLLLIATASHANEISENPEVPIEAQKSIITGQKQRASPPFPQFQGENQQNHTEPLQRFEPKERIPAGSAISFPTDI